MNWLLIAVFILIGFLFLLLEMLVIPGFGFAGVIGFILVAVGVWQTYAVYGMTAGHLVLAGSFLFTLLALAFALRGKTWKRISLSDAINSKVNVVDTELVRPGDTGRTISRLAPSGKAIIKGEYYEVRTNGEFLDEQTEIVVLKMDQNKIIVKRKE